MFIHGLSSLRLLLRLKSLSIVDIVFYFNKISNLKNCSQLETGTDCCTTSCEECHFVGTKFYDIAVVVVVVIVVVVKQYL